MNFKIKKETKISIIEDYVCGLSIFEIYKKYNLNRQSVQYILGGYLGSRKLASLNTNNPYNHAKLLAEYQQKNLTLTQRHPFLIYE